MIRARVAAPSGPKWLHLRSSSCRVELPRKASTSAPVTQGGCYIRELEHTARASVPATGWLLH